MRPIIGCHLAVLIIIHGGFLGDCTQGRERVLEKSEDENELKYIQRKRNSGTHAAPEFSKYHVIHPKVYHTVQKHEIDLKQVTQKKTTQRDAKIHDLNDLTLTFQSEGQNFIVDLHLNHQLIPDGYFQKYHKEVSSISNNIFSMYLNIVLQRINLTSATILFKISSIINE